jgi:rhodanese-related sulfurtransferase
MTHTPQDLVTQAKNEVPSISCEEFKKMQGEDNAYTLIDVREQDEWDAGHIQEAIHIPRGMLEFKIGEAVPNKDDLIVVQCASGGRAALCGQQLIKLGYTNVKNLEGGYTSYCEA